MGINWKTISIKKLAVLTGGVLKKHNIDAVLTGGACVSIYTRNRYCSMDLDFVSGFPLKEIEPVMNKLGFKLKNNYFARPDCALMIEFPPPPVSIGNEISIEKFNTIQTLTLLTPTDCVKDRLAAYYHWNDPQSLEQALMVACSQKVNMKNIREWSVKEMAEEKFFRFEEILKNRRKSRKKQP